MVVEGKSLDYKKRRQDVYGRVLFDPQILPKRVNKREERGTL